MTEVDASGCPSVATLQDLLDEKLQADSSRSVEQHIAACAVCQTTLDSLTISPLVDQSLSKRSSARLDKVIANLKSGDLRTSSRSLAHGKATAERPHAVGRYEIQREIGSGAMGILYEGLDPQLGRRVAIKVLRKSSDSPESRERILREARAVVNIKHEGIVRVYDVIQDENAAPAIVMEYVNGGSIDRLISQRALSPRQSAEVVRQAATGLHAAHAENLVHRDVKPSNILFEFSEGNHRVCVADFGLVAVLEDDSQLTRTGEIAGTPAYMSPEQVETPSEVDGLSDIYSLGCVLYEMLTGRPPFDGTMRMVLWQVLNELPKAPTLLDDRIPKPLEAICLKCLEKKPEQRYGSAEELGKDLQRFLDGDAVLAKSPGLTTHLFRFLSRHPVAVSVAGLLLLSVLSIAAVASYFAVRLSTARDQEELQALKAKQGRDVALEALESVVFDAYDKLDRSGYDPDVLQIELLQAAASSLERIEVDRESQETLVQRIETHARIARAMWRLGQLKKADSQIGKATQLLNGLDSVRRQSIPIKQLELQLLSSKIDVHYELGNELVFARSLAVAKKVIDELNDAKTSSEKFYACAAEVFISEANALEGDGQPTLAPLLAARSYHDQLGVIAKLSYAEALSRLEILGRIGREQQASQASQALKVFSRLAAASNQRVQLDLKEGYEPDSAFLGFRLMAQLGILECQQAFGEQRNTKQLLESGWRILLDLMNQDAVLVDSSDAWGLIHFALDSGDETRGRWLERAVQVADWEAGASGTVDDQVNWRRRLLELLRNNGQQVEAAEVEVELRNLIGESASNPTAS